MEWIIDIIGVIVLPILWAIYNKFSAIEKSISTLSENLALCCQRMETIAKENKQQSKKINHLYKKFYEHINSDKKRK